MPGSGFEKEVAERFGVPLNFFRATAAPPEFHEQFWRFAKAAYLDNPLPSLFKERVFVHLSRFCEARYCIVRHAAFLAGFGYPAGDRTATPLSVEQVIEFLERPARGNHGNDALAAVLDRLETSPTDATPRELDLIDAVAAVFLDPANSARARNALRRALEDRKFELLTALLSYIRTEHSWAETHPEITCEPDAVEMLENHPKLAGLLHQAAGRRVEEAERLEGIHHRVYNDLQIISSLLGIESNRAQDPRARAAFLEMRNRVHSIATVHAVLKQSSWAAVVDLVACARQLVPEIVRLCDTAARIVPEVSGKDVTLDLERAVPWALLLNELVSAVCKRAASAAGALRLSVSLARAEDRIVMTVADTAPGAPLADGRILKSLERQLRAELKMAPGHVTVAFPDLAHASTTSRSRSHPNKRA